MDSDRPAIVGSIILVSGFYGTRPAIYKQLGELECEIWRLKCKGWTKVEAKTPQDQPAHRTEIRQWTPESQHRLTSLCLLGGSKP